MSQADEDMCNVMMYIVTVGAYIEASIFLNHTLARAQKIHLSRKQLATLSHLRSGHCKFWNSYKKRLVVQNCGMDPHDVPIWFTAHPTDMTIRHVCQVDTASEFSKPRQPGLTDVNG